MEKHTWTMGINDFADLTSEEIQQQMLMEPINSMNCYEMEKPQEGKQKLPEKPKAVKRFKSSKNLNLDRRGPVVFDFTWYGKVPGPKNQGYCGSMWAFSAVGSLETFWNVKGLGTPNKTFSEQLFIDCSLGRFGCDGGVPFMAL